MPYIKVMEFVQYLWDLAKGVLYNTNNLLLSVPTYVSVLLFFFVLFWPKKGGKMNWITQAIQSHPAHGCPPDGRRGHGGGDALPGPLAHVHVLPLDACAHELRHGVDIAMTVGIVDMDMKATMLLLGQWNMNTLNPRATIPTRASVAIVLSKIDA